MNFRERIEYLLALIAPNDRDIEALAGIKYNSLKTIRSRGRIGVEGIIKLCEYFPDLNLKWLILDDEIERNPFEKKNENEQPYTVPRIVSAAVEEPVTVSYMKSSSLYNYPLLVDEVESIRKTVAELRKNISELKEKLSALEQGNNSQDK